MNLRKCYLTKNDCYKSGKKIKPVGVMVHSTGANNPNIKRYVQPDDGILGQNNNNNHWNRAGVEKCVHAFIGKGKDGKIYTYQTLPFDYRGWHAGGAANNTHISFEICEDNLTDKTYFDCVYEEAVEFTAYLCKLYHLDPQKDGVVICHKEGYDRGIASGHTDVLHWFPKHGKSMNDFRDDVAKKMIGGEIDMTKEEVQELVKDEVNKAVADLKPIVYKSVNDVPSWGIDTVEKLVSQNKLRGDENGDLNLTHDLLRALVIMNR